VEVYELFSYFYKFMSLFHYLLLSLCIFFGWFISFQSVSWLTIHLPLTTEDDLVAEQETITQQDSRDSFINLIRFINSYLWFALAGVGFAVLIYAGFQMITGRWDESKFKTWMMTAVYAGIGIWVALMAYAAVNIVINIMGSW
jgi:hypothetical protein